MNVISHCAFLIPPVIAHIWGPININSYGLFILLGIFISSLLLARDPWRKKLISMEVLSEIVIIATIIGVLGGRLLYCLFEYHEFTRWFDIFALWQGGFSVLGSIISIILFMSLYLYRISVPVMPLFDLVCVYAPLLQAVARLGCFFSGCCFGVPTYLPWAVMYIHKESSAPLFMLLHPTQLYSVCAYLCIFGVIFFMRKKLIYRSGLFLATYLLLSSLERFAIDFLRADRIFYAEMSISIYQCIALFISFCALIKLFLILFHSKKRLHGFV